MICEFNLESFLQRIRVMNFLRNISKCLLRLKLFPQNAYLLYYYLGRILPIIVNLCPAREIPDFSTLVRSNGTIVELGYHVKKIFREERSIEHLREIYRTLFVSMNKFSLFRVRSNKYIAK